MAKGRQASGNPPTPRALHKGTTGIPAATEHKTYRKMKTQDRISGNVAKWAGGRHADNGGKARQLMAVRIPPNEMTGIQCREMDIQRGRNTGENRTHRKRKTENPPLYRKEEVVFASSFLFIATMSRL